MSQNNSQTTDLSSIPTISHLYKDSRLHPVSPDTPTNQPSSILNSKVSLVQTSITTLAVTSIVNAANKSLLGGGGVDGAIHRSAGPSLLVECRTLGGCATGSAKLTSAYDLPSKYVIHTVGPIYQNAEVSSILLASCYRTSLELAAEKGGSVAFSCVSTGIYGYPSFQAAEIAAGEVRRFLVEQEEDRQDAGKEKLERVIFCCFEDKDVRAYEKWLPRTFPPTESELPADRSLPSEPATSIPTPAPARPQPTAHPTGSVVSDDQATEDWETVEKPDDIPAAVQASELSDEGVEVDAVDSDLGVSEVVSEIAKDEDKQDEKRDMKPVEHGLSKDW